MVTDGPWFKDELGRTLILRGANLGGSSKVPYTPNGATHIRAGFYAHRTVSFVGRPFPLDEADEHLRRFQAWGLTFLRFLITWEAVEHAGPGEYDEAYLDYVRAVVRKAGEYGIDVFIDPHQDVWSRFTGGDGAPGWTLEAIGMDITQLNETGAAIVHAIHGDPFPRMIWPTNHEKLGAATLFTLFFAGNDFAPATRVDGVPVQEYLQKHYLDAVKQVALRLCDLPNVVGYDSLNEPGPGYIGLADLAAPWPGLLRSGLRPTPFQGMLLAAGHPQEVPVWRMGVRSRQIGARHVNAGGISLWRPGRQCIWQENGVWTDDGGAPRLLRPGHFAEVRGRRVDFVADYLKPFLLRFTREIRTVDPRALVFIEGLTTGPHLEWGPDDPPGAVHAGHWYDALTLIGKRFNPLLNFDIHTRRPVLGLPAIRRMFARQLGTVKRAARQMNHIPTLIGEFGLPMDMDEKAAYRTGNFAGHVRSLDAYFDALDANLLSGTIWNYTADNTNAHGDQWNDEDLSIFSRDQQTAPDDINSGGRGLAGFVRPYARKIAGEPLRMGYELRTGTFELTYRGDPNVDAATELFVPNYAYPRGYCVTVTGGTYEADPVQQIVLIRHAPDAAEHRVRIIAL